MNRRPTADDLLRALDKTYTGIIVRHCAVHRKLRAGNDNA